jgi:Leucine-rich repeat (LRR) protein
LSRNMEKAKLDESPEESRLLERSSRSPSPPPYSPRDSTNSPLSALPVDIKSRQSTLPAADPSDPAFVLVSSAINPSTRTVNLSSRSLSSLPGLSTGSPPTHFSVPSHLDLSRNTLAFLPLASIDSWNWTSTLRTLTVTHNRLSALTDPQSSISFSPLLSLTALDLSNNHLCSTSTSSSSKPLLTHLDELFPSLRSLTLSYNRLTSLEGIESLLLPSSNDDEDKSYSPPRLKTLYLNGNKISDTSALCRVAEKMGAMGGGIQGKSVVGNKITNDHRWSLEELDLRDNEIARVSMSICFRFSLLTQFQFLLYEFVLCESTKRY